MITLPGSDENTTKCDRDTIKNHSSSADFLNTPTSTPCPTMLEDDEQPRFLSGWVPVVKIFTTKNRSVRALWALFTVCMVVVLVSSITLVVHRYLSYVTVVRLDERGPQDDIPPPALTICLVEHELSNLNVEKFRSLGKHNWNIMHGATKHCDENNVVTWNSRTDAVSPIYELSAHMTVTLATDPVVCFTLRVLEQVPRPPHSICTTFETMPRFPRNTSFWKVLRVQVTLAEPNQSMLGRPSIIVHDQNSIPLNKLARSINEFITPGTGVSLFYNKEITKRLSTRSSPCNSHPVRIMDHEYKYDQVACQWRAVCLHYHANCHCLCPLEMLRRHLDDKVWHTSNVTDWFSAEPIQTNCPARCHHNYPIALVNSTTCPQACLAVTYKRINRFVDTSGHRGQFSLYLIQPEGLTEMIEEELYSLPKLFSEIGGLSSFCFGFSCILFFELFELAFWLRCTYRSQFTSRLNEYLAHDAESTNAHQSFSLAEQMSHPNLEYSDPAPSRHNSMPIDFDIGEKHCMNQKTDSSLLHQLRPTSLDPIRPTKPGCSSTTQNLVRTAPSHHIILNPLQMCLVDGTRLSQYPSELDSPILGLKRLNLVQPVEHHDYELLGSDHDMYLQHSQDIHVLVQIDGESFSIPMEITTEIP